jgi:hypothetical protein
MYKSYTIKSMLIFSLCWAPMRGIGIDINNPGLTMWQLLNTMYSATINTNTILAALTGSSMTDAPIILDPASLGALTYLTVNTNAATLNGIDDTTTATLDAVRKNGSCIAQIMHNIETNQQDIDAKLDELASDDAQLFSAIEGVDKHVLQTCKAVKLGDMMLRAKMNALSCQVAECCEELSGNDAQIFSMTDVIDTNVTANSMALVELSDNDAKIFSAIESLDGDVESVGTAVIVGNAILGMQVNNLSNQLTDCCEELSENDAKIFSAVERIDTTLGSIFCATQKERETAIVESPTAPHQVKFIKNKHVNRAGGIVISEPGLYMLTESLTIDAGQGISIQADNVTVDLNGFTITANSEFTTPLSATQADVVLIKNGVISGGQGIAITGSYGVTLENLVVTYPFNTGIALHDVHGITIDHCTVREGVQAGITADTGSTQITIRDTAVSDCQGNGFDLQAQGILLANSAAQHNGGTGITISNSTDVHIQRAIVDSNSSNGIFVDSSVERVQVESCRVMGNGAIGCVDNGATLATWMNNLASGNMQEDYQNIKAVLIGKATSFWHNVYGN